MTYVRSKINEVYNVALKLGIKNASDIERKLFKDLLYQIAVAVNDETRHKVAELMSSQSYKYTGGATENESKQ